LKHNIIIIYKKKTKKKIEKIEKEKKRGKEINK